MRCHYEVLGVSQNATDDDLKKAYKKLALQWHPDKNPSQVDEAKRRFLEIREAYEVLSDPRERSWYDAHRDVMLNKASGDDYKDDTINIYPFFTSSCYQGFDDGENGFYTIYNKLFKDIAEQDLKATNDKTIIIPEFGNSLSDYDEIVGPFYGYWSSYCTLRSYVWVEEHDTREAIDRRVRRLMEQENKKLRDKARKERNEAVRELVAFVKKRDKRIQLRKIFLEEQAAQKKKADTERRNREKLKKLEELAQYKDAHWMSFDEFEKQLEDLEKHADEKLKKPSKNVAAAIKNDSEDESDDVDDELYCVACNKSFKSDKAFLNHENSKKHKDLVQLMKAHMQEENETLIMDQNNPNPTRNDHEQEKVQLPINDQSKKSKKKKKKQRRNNKDDVSSDDEIEEIKNSMDASNEAQDEPEHIGDLAASAEKPTKKKTRPNNETDKPDEEASQQPVVLQCFVCQEEFTSRNALFKHIKELDHAKPLTVKSETNKMTNMKPVLLLVPKTLLKSFGDMDELPLSYRHLVKGRQFSLGDQKLRARPEKTSMSEFFCFQKTSDGNEGQLISSSVETYSFIQDIDPQIDCAPKEITFRPEFPDRLKLRCLPFGSTEPKNIRHRSKSKKKLKRLTN